MMKGVIMSYVLTDYQIVAIFSLGFMLATIIFMIILEKKDHPEWTWYDLYRHEMFEVSPEIGRTVRSKPVRTHIIVL